MKEEERSIQIMIKDIVTAFRRFESDSMHRLTQAGVSVEGSTRVLTDGMYGCLFEAVHTALKLSGKERGDVPHERAFSDYRIHERVANGILEVMLRSLEGTNSKYRWQIMLVKREKRLIEP